MRYLIIGKILGLLLAVFSIIATAPAIVVAIIYQEDTLLNFAASFPNTVYGWRTDVVALPRCKKRPAKPRWVSYHRIILDRSWAGWLIAVSSR